MEPLRSNNLEVRLANGEAEIDAAQSLRYRVFYDEMGAVPTPRNESTGRDVVNASEGCDQALDDGQVGIGFRVFRIESDGLFVELDPRGLPARCGASRPFSRISLSTRRFEVRIPAKRSRAQTLR